MSTITTHELSILKARDKVQAFALLHLLNGVGEKWWEVKEETGLPRLECEKLLFARDCAWHYHGEEWLGDNRKHFCRDYRATNGPYGLLDWHDDGVRHESGNAFGEINKGYYTDADRRMILAEYLRRGWELSDMMKAFYAE